ncbi:nitroreductase family deazaflavin-dependent oxidoreductase [Mycobacterium sp.]|uniref:nitroreductase family deazaflavin-dependent oxidoreductase n=1 Tax=Mycobacterium sp. TaxID=1785 RepID=UPI003BAA370A
MSSAPASSRFARVGARLLRSRRLMRMPIWIYKARAGALFGSRILMLEHIGRKSGTPRYVVLEVLGQPAPDTYVIASGLGRKAQWFRNIQANPRVRVYTGSRAPAPANARVLDQSDADRTLAAYRDRHPRAWRQLKGILEETLGTPVTDVDTPLPIVELRLS